jgi:hypothetical protein
MLGSAARSRSSAAARSRGAFARNAAAVLRQPLSDLLLSGGDDRLLMVGRSGINVYGCTPTPRSDVAEFASSTATTISKRAFDRAERAQAQLAERAESEGIETAFESRMEELRAELRATLRISEETEIVFAPSGTDGALFAVFLARALLGAPIDNIMMVSDETGRGIPFASIGRHFSICTALGNSVMKGEPVEGLPRGMASLGFSGRDVEGAPVDTAQIDKTVTSMVQQAIGQGKRVLLNAMDCSRTGLSGPSLSCLEDLASRWPDSVLVLVDACQMRLTREDLNAYLARNFMVLVTGSKFFTGPAFSGALLVPKDVADRAADIADVPVGLGAYTARASWPRRWSGIRDGLPLEQNVGEWLRWEAALAEMQAYYKVPRAFRRGAVDAFNIAFSAYSDEIDGIDAAPGLSLSQGLRRSIAPFFLTRQGRRLTVDEATALYRRLNDEIALAAPGACHLGQPIAFGLGPKENAGAFRASLSARIVSDAWAAGDPTTALRRLNGEIARLGAALERVAFMASHGTLSTKKR